MATTTAPLVVTPVAPTYDLLLTATTGISHHDPAVQDDSNTTLFNRQKQILTGPAATTLPDRAALDALAAAHPVPADLAPLCGDLSVAEFVAVALLRLFLDLYNAGEGEGVYSGRERYSRLEARARQAAIGSASLRAWWDRLVVALQVGMHDGDRDRPLLALLTLPRGLHPFVLRALVDDARSLVALARAWHATAKLQSTEYAQASGQPTAAPGLVALHWDASDLTGGSAVARVMELPAVSGNSLRHQVVRAPAWRHLASALGLSADRPGRGPLPGGVEAIFVNGGNIRAGAKQPTNPHALAWAIRALYPTLDLLGGVTDSFDLGESRLKVAGWLVCRENRDALLGSAAVDHPAATLSAVDLIDTVTLTRQAGLTGLGQMIYSFETLAPGTPILCRLTLAPETAALTHGALIAAVETFLALESPIGGQSARGFGQVAGAWLDGNERARSALRTEYEAYLTEQADALRAGLVDGTLGSGRVVAS